MKRKDEKIDVVEGQGHITMQITLEKLKYVHYEVCSSRPHREVSNLAIFEVKI